MNLQRTFFLITLFFARSVMAKQHNVTVFIHGTCQAGLALLNPKRTYLDKFNGKSWFELTLAQTRTDGYLEKSDLMLGLGLTDVTELISKPIQDPEVCHKAAINCVRAYDAFIPKNKHEQNHYYTFGWLGLMSETCREQASEQLYDCLYNLKQEFTKNNDTVTFTLQSHSHGGQLVLHLAQVRKERGDHDFFIDYAIMSATPLYYHKAKYAASGMFKVILNMHAQHDMIQVGDKFSTPEHGCTRTFKAVKMPLPSGNTDAPLIADVCMHIEDRADIFGHACFFILDRYTVFNFINRPQRKKIRSTLQLINPVPLVVLYPVIVPEIVQQIKQTGVTGYHQLTCNLKQNAAHELVCEIIGAEKTSSVIFPADSLMTNCEQVKMAYANTTYTTELQKAMHSFTQIFSTLPKTKK